MHGTKKKEKQEKRPQSKEHARGHAVNHRRQHLVEIQACLSRNLQHLLSLDLECPLYLIQRLVHIRHREVYLTEDRNDLQVGVKREEEVGHLKLVKRERWQMERKMKLFANGLIHWYDRDTKRKRKRERNTHSLCLYALRCIYQQYSA